MSTTPTTVVTGLLAALCVNPYEITDRETGEVNRGDSIRLYVCSDDGTALDEIRVSQKNRHIVEGIPHLTPVRVECEVRASTKPGSSYATTYYQALSVQTPIPANG